MTHPFHDPTDNSTDEGSTTDPTVAALHADLDDDLARQFRAVAVDPRLRRFTRALADLGMPVPADWATSSDATRVEFADLSWHVFDRLVCLMEDLADHRPVAVVVAPSGPTLFDPGAASGPTTTSSGAGLHIVVPA